MSKSMIGIISEDDSDFVPLSCLIRRVSTNQKLSFKKKLGRGGGNIIKKCGKWSIELKSYGCSKLIIAYDSDEHSPSEIYGKVKCALGECPISKYIICVPVQEIEAWFLSDLENLNSIFRFNTKPKLKGDLENINSPKEKLEEIVYKNANKLYLNTAHNGVIAENINVQKIRGKCPSFEPLYSFIKNEIS